MPEFDHAVLQEFAEAVEQVEFPLVERPIGREPESVDRQVIDVEENALLSRQKRSFSLSSNRRDAGVSVRIQIEIEEQRSAARLTETVERGVPLDFPGAVDVDDAAKAADGRQQNAEELERDVLTLLGFRVIEAGIVW